MATAAHETVGISRSTSTSNPTTTASAIFSSQPPSTSTSSSTPVEAASPTTYTSLKVSKQGVPLNLQGPILTGAAALAEQQRAKDVSMTPSSSPNPAMNAIKALMPDQHQPTERLTQPTTRITDADGASMPMTDEPMQIDQGQANASEYSENVHDPRLANTATNGSATVSTSDERNEERSNKAYTYPPRPDQPHHRGSPTRGMSLPNSTSKSPGSKKHRCNHCGTEFTRHHNLKSHLLTHSQEKPFCCDRCDQKFRRLHDLKRHAKLHTGERPHTCPKCGRAFARGDALARHNKGPGGCAGRRGSGGDEDLEGVNGDESMEGVIYDENGDSQSSKRRKSEQTHNRKRSFQSTTNSSSYRQHSSTYPGPAPIIGTQPQNHTSAQSHRLSPRMNNGQTPFSSQLGAPQSVFAQGGMTESPKPLSPGAEQSRRLSAGLPYPHHACSPGLAQQSQYHHQLHRGTDQNSPSTVGTSGSPGQTVLPSLGSLASDNQQPSFPPSMNSASGTKLPRPPPSISTSYTLAQPGPNSAGSTNPPSASSQHRSSGGSMREILNHGPTNDRPPEFIRKADAEQEIQRLREEMNQRVQQYENKLRDLQEENSMLKAKARGRPAQQVEGAPASHSSTNG